MMDLTEQRFTRVVTPGMVDIWENHRARLYVTITHRFEPNQKWELSIMGVEGPKSNGDAAGSCGQCVDSLTRLTVTDPVKWPAAKIANLRDVWNRWHLNGMQAGSPAQSRYLREHPYDRERDGDHYDWARRTLAAVGLHPDPNFGHPTKTVDHVTVSAAHGVVHTAVPRPYEYGAAWLYEPVPVEVLSWLYNLPKAVKDHPWGDHDVFGPDMPEGWDS